MIHVCFPLITNALSRLNSGTLRIKRSAAFPRAIQLETGEARTGQCQGKMMSLNENMFGLKPVFTSRYQNAMERWISIRTGQKLWIYEASAEQSWSHNNVRAVPLANVPVEGQNSCGTPGHQVAQNLPSNAGDAVLDPWSGNWDSTCGATSPELQVLEPTHSGVLKPIEKPCTLQWKSCVATKTWQPDK